MNIYLDSIPCSINNFLRLIKTGIVPEKLKDPVLRELLKFFSEEDYNQSPPALGQKMHRMLREFSKNSDPYEEIKRKYNRMMMDKYLDFKKIIEDSQDPFETAVRLAIAGNVIDFGSHHQLDVMESIERVLNAELALDDSDRLKHDIESARTLLYIGDNAGEIVLDKLLLETINHPNVTFAVRGSPVINDATEEDAVMTGIDRVAKIVTTGDDAPGVILETCSPDFVKIFNEADVVIAKGQGNLEGLIDGSRGIYFLLTTKCQLISEHLGVKEKDFVVFKKNQVVLC
jgi:uncharacterized protein with ATP-grasp and redox domains